MAFAGELGAGKTWAIMTLLFHLVDIGGQFLAIDRTDQGEYASPVSTLANSVVVDMMRPRWSMDPLRIFPADIGVDKAVDLLTPLFGCTADSPQGLTLGELLHPELGVRSIPDMLAVLQRGHRHRRHARRQEGAARRDGPNCTGTWTTGRASATPRR